MADRSNDSTFELEPMVEGQHGQSSRSSSLRMSRMFPLSSLSNVFRMPNTSSLPRSTFFISKSDLMTERLVHSTSTLTAQRNLHWRILLPLVVSFLVGISVTLSQHFLYRFLHHTTEDKENTKIGLVLCGRALAYIAKIAFGHCIILCYRQRLWRTLKERALSVRSIDQLFRGTDDVMLFLNWEAISNAPLLAGMALVVWLLPLATVISSPSALSLGWHPEVRGSLGLVPTLDFSAESLKNWRFPKYLPSGETEISLVYYNTTDFSGTQDGWFDYYDSPSDAIKNLTKRNFFNDPSYILKNAFSQDTARQKSCGGNFNCTYTISFLGPGYNCDDVTSDIGNNTNLTRTFINTHDLVPEGRYLYHASMDSGAYLRPQAENLGFGGIPEGDIPDDFGVFKFVPELLIGYATNSTEWLPETSPFAKNWTHRWDPHILRCILYDTNYTVKWNFTGQTCQIESSFDFIAPINSNDSSGPEDFVVKNWVSPRTDVARYKKTAAYYAMSDTFGDLLRGRVEMTPPIPGPVSIRLWSDVTGTPLFGLRWPREDLKDQVQNYFSKIILTLLTQSNLVIISEEEVFVNRTRFQVTFIYDPVRLWICYTPVLLLTLTILLIGVWTIWEDGTTFSTGFSRILATTRNPTLDEISQGACLGSDPFPQKLMEKKLIFGALCEDARLDEIDTGFHQHERVGHCAFGLPTEVVPIQRGALYAGLSQGNGIEKERKEKVE